MCGQVMVAQSIGWIRYEGKYRYMGKRGKYLMPYGPGNGYNGAGISKCKSCAYFSTDYVCNYVIYEGKMRPCAPGDECTEWIEASRKNKTAFMAKVRKANFRR